MAVTESSEHGWPQRRGVMKTTRTDKTVEQLVLLPNRAVRPDDRNQDLPQLATGQASPVQGLLCPTGESGTGDGPAAKARQPRRAPSTRVQYKTLTWTIPGHGPGQAAKVVGPGVPAWQSVKAGGSVLARLSPVSPDEIL